MVRESTTRRPHAFQINSKPVAKLWGATGAVILAIHGKDHEGTGTIITHQEADQLAAWLKRFSTWAKKEERRLHILEMRAEGKTLKEIGKEFGISRQAIHSVLNK